VVNLPAPVPEPDFEDALSRPDFVLFGITDPLGGVILFASKELTKAKLESKVVGLEVVPLGPIVKARVADRRTTLYAEFKNFTMIRAETYPEAFRSLMSTWRPPDPRRALPQ
jgi:hypothetical protein